MLTIQPGDEVVFMPPQSQSATRQFFSKAALVAIYGSRLVMVVGLLIALLCKFTNRELVLEWIEVIAKYLFVIIEAVVEFVSWFFTTLFA